MIKTLFSIPITNTILNLDLKELVAFSLETKNKDKGKSFTNIGGWQSNNLKDKPPCIGILEKNIIYNIKILQKEYGLKKTAQPVIESIWVNINNKGDSNDRHVHPGCVFSGVFYVQCDEECPANLLFFNPSYDLIQYDWKKPLYEKFNEHNSSMWYFSPKPNNLILFPSWLQHSVESNPSLNTRISISFNIQLHL